MARKQGGQEVGTWKSGLHVGQAQQYEAACDASLGSFGIDHRFQNGGRTIGIVMPSLVVDVRPERGLRDGDPEPPEHRDKCEVQARPPTVHSLAVPRVVGQSFQVRAGSACQVTTWPHDGRNAVPFNLLTLPTNKEG